MEYQTVGMMEKAVDARRPTFVVHLGIRNEETEVNLWQRCSQQKLRNAEFTKEWTLGTLTQLLKHVKITDNINLWYINTN
jgi:hypothetical protein